MEINNSSRQNSDQKEIEFLFHKILSVYPSVDQSVSICKLINLFPHINLQELIFSIRLFPISIYDQDNLISSFVRLQSLKLRSPDHPLTLESIRNSFCVLKKYSPLSDILKVQKSNNTPDFLLQLQTQSINIYALFALDNLIPKLYEFRDLGEFMLPNIYSNISQIQTLYNNSKKCRILVENLKMELVF